MHLPMLKLWPRLGAISLRYCWFAEMALACTVTVIDLVID